MRCFASMLVAGLCLGGAACGGFLGISEDVEIRVRNASTIDFDSVVVGPVRDYGAIAAGGVSDYRTFDVAYRYAYVRVVTAGETYQIMPIDYVGEEELEGGKYTYELNLTDGHPRSLTLRFVED